MQVITFLPVRPRSAPKRHCVPQEQPDGVSHAGPELVVVRLETTHRSFINGSFQEDEEPSLTYFHSALEVIVRAPHTNTAAGKLRIRVYALRVQRILNLIVDSFKIERAA